MIDRDLVRASAPPIFAACVLALIVGVLDDSHGPEPSANPPASAQPATTSHGVAP